MILNPAIPSQGAVPHAFTLNDLRVHPSVAEEASSTSARNHSGLVLVVVLAIGAFAWLDPLRLLTPTEASPPAPDIVPATEPARPTERQEVIAPLVPVPATKSVEVPIAPASLVQAPHVPALVVRPRPANIKPESRGNPPMDKTNTTVLKANPKEEQAPPVSLTNSEERTTPPALQTKPEEGTAPPILQTKPEEKTAPPVLLNEPEEKSDAPIVLKPGDDTKNAPKSATTNDQSLVTE